MVRFWQWNGFVQDRINLGELRERGVLFFTREAAAILYEICSRLNNAEEAGQPLEPPALDDLWVTHDGELVMEETPADPAHDPMPDLAALVEAVLPPTLRDQPEYGVPSSFRLLAPRARGWPPGLPPIRAPGDLAAAVNRYRQGSGTSILQALFTRTVADSAETPTGVDDLWLHAPAQPDEGAVPEGPLPDSEPADFVRSQRSSLPAGDHRVARYARGALVSAALLLLAFAVSYQVTRRVIARHEKPARADVSQSSAPIVDKRTVDQSTAEGQSTAERQSTAEGERDARRPTTTALVAAPLDIPASTGPVFSPSFTASGSSLLFHAGRDPVARLMRTDLRGDAAPLNVVTILHDEARDYHPRLSPDGRYLAFDSDRDGIRGVYVANADGSGPHRISGPGFAAVPAWAPDMRGLAFVRGEPGRPQVWNLWLHDLATDTDRRLTAYRYGQTWGGSWFPDSRHLCYSHEDQLVIQDVESGQTRVLRSPYARHLVRTPAVSPDGRQIAFQVMHRGVWLLDVESGAMRRVIDDASAEEFAWDPHGHRLAYHSRRSGAWQIWVATMPAR